MELKPSTYYLDAIKERAKQRELDRQKELTDISEASVKAAEAKRIADEKAEQERQKRRIEAQESMIQASSASMWGSDDAVVKQLSQSITQNMDRYVDDNETFQKILATLDSFVDNSKSYYTGTRKSFLDATERAGTGGKNPFEINGYHDTRTLAEYEETAKTLDISVPSVKILDDGSITINGTPIDDYMSSRSGENADPFAPKLEPLPPITAEEVYLANRGALTHAPNRDAYIEKLLDEIISNPIKLGRLIADENGYDAEVSKPILVQTKRNELKKQLMSIIEAGGIKESN
jgi:hypothetical protein